MRRMSASRERGAERKAQRTEGWMLRRRMGSLWKAEAQLPKTSKVAPDNDIKMSLSLKRRPGSRICPVF